MVQPPQKSMDFEAWKRLAAEDPAAFEALRRQCLDEAIARAPRGQQERLRRLQWRIEQARRRAANPLAACITLSNMMWESLAGPDGLLQALRMEGRSPRRTAAKVLRLPPERH